MVVKYRRPNRLKNFDYSSSGYYFVTICTKNRYEYFGNVVNNKMVLNGYGKIAQYCWLEIPKHFPNIELGGFQIMPNHVHGIIIIQNSNKPVGNAYMRSLQSCHWQYRTKMLLSKIIHEYKSAISRLIREFDSTFRWQKSFYDNIIRNEYSLFIIREYVKNNPSQWNFDRNNLIKKSSSNSL